MAEVDRVVFVFRGHLGIVEAAVDDGTLESGDVFDPIYRMTPKAARHFAECVLIAAAEAEAQMPALPDL